MPPFALTGSSLEIGTEKDPNSGSRFAEAAAVARFRNVSDEFDILDPGAA
jgi:hypothetical protein